MEDGAPAVIPDKPKPKYEGKRARQERRDAEAEYAYAKFKEKQAVLEAGPNQEEVERFLALNTPATDSGPELPLRTAETSSASRPTSLWSDNSEQYLRVPPQGGTSSSASSRASKRNRSPSPHGYRDSSHTAHRGRGGRLDSRPPPGQYIRPLHEAEEEIHNLQAELQRLCEFGREDRERIRYLERQLTAERQLGIAEGLAQAARQLMEQSRGPSPTRYYDKDEYVRDMRRAAEESRRTHREERAYPDPSSGAGPSRSGALPQWRLLVIPTRPSWARTPGYLLPPGAARAARTTAAPTGGYHHHQGENQLVA
jgi:hypothetical protein